MSKDPIMQPFFWGGHGMPGYWRYVLPKEVLDWDVPKEEKSTCSNCPQICTSGYDKTYRCCSYFPEVPNFLLGLALKDPVAKKQVKSLHKNGFLIPEGFQNTPAQWVDYLADCSGDGFGKAERVKCPMLNTSNGYCGIYAFRNSVCSTFFCINDHGSKGQKFWVQMEEVVCQTESSIGQWVLNELGFDNDAYIKRMNSLAKKVKKLHDPKTGGWNQETLEYLWADYYGRELELLEACGELVSKERENLWTIANAQRIIEPEKYNTAMVRNVPKKFADEIDPSDLEENGDDDEYLTPAEILKDLKKTYKKMHKIPKKLNLSDRVEIRKNSLESKEDRFYSKQPFILEYLTKKKKKIDWREYISEDEAKALNHFKKTKKTEEKLLADAHMKKVNDDFLSKWVSKGVLKKP